MARSHYVMDLFYPTKDGSEPKRGDALRIDAEDDDAAIAEASRIDGWRKTQFYRLRAIHNSSRNGDKLVFSSEVVEAASADTGREAPVDAGAAEPAAMSAPRAAKATR